MDERKRFREKATRWARQSAEKDAEPSKWLFIRRAKKAFGAAFYQVNAWIEPRWKALLWSLRIGVAAGAFLSEEEYEEAETYRDKNAAELRLVYQKRLHDKELQERWKALGTVSAAAAVALLALSVVAIRGCVAEGEAKIQAQTAEADATKGWLAEGEAKKQAQTAEAEALDAKQREEAARKLANLHVADLYHEKSAQREADDWDASGAFLWYAAGWSIFDASSQVLDFKPEERDRLRTSYRVQLATARDRLPFLSGLAYHKNRLASAHTPDGRFLLTVGADGAGRTTSPVVQFWRWTDKHEHPEWEPIELRWGQAPPEHAFTQATAYLSPNGRFAVVSGGRTDAALAICVWKLPEAGPGEFVRELKGYEGKLTSAGFSHDGQFFAVVSQLKGKYSVRYWRSSDWDTPNELSVPDGAGRLGQLAFRPTPSSNRMAVAVAPDPLTLGADQSVVARGGTDRLICLEWSLNESREEPPSARPYTLPEWFRVNSLQGDVQTFVSYKPDGSELLVSSSFQNLPFAYVWLFDSSKKDSTTESVTVPRPQFLNPPPAAPVLHGAFSRWDDRLVIVNGNGQAELWGPGSIGQGNKQYTRIRTLERKPQIFKAEFSSDGQYVVTTSRDYKALVWHADSGRLAHPSFYHSAPVTDASFTESGRSLITSSGEMIQRWDLTRGESRPLPVGTLRGAPTTSADPEGNLVVTAGGREPGAEQLGSAGWARVWDTVTGDPRSPELRHPAPVLQAAISGTDRELVSTVTSEGEVRLWKASSRQELWVEKPAKGIAVYTAFGRADGQDHLLALIHSDPRSLPSTSFLRIYPLNSSGERTDGVRTFTYPGTFTGAAFSPDCKHVTAYTGGGGNSHGEAVVWDLPSGKQTILKGSGKSGSAHDKPITHVAYTNDGAYLVTTGRDGRAFVWDLSDGSKEELLARKDEEIGHIADVEFATFDPAGNRVVTAGADGWAIIWERVPGQRQFHLIQKLKNDQALTQAVFGTNKQYVLTADTDGTTRLFNIKDWRPLVTNSHPGQTILQFVFREEKEGKNRHTSVYLIGNQSRGGPTFANRAGQRPNFPVANAPGALACPMVTKWRLTGDVPPTEDYGPLAKWTASRKLDDAPFRTELTSLTQDVVLDLWKSTGARPEHTGPLPNDQLGAWHEREAALCELDRRWRPAIEHWTLALVNPSVDRRSILLGRRARAYGELSDWDHAEGDLNEALSKISGDSELLQARANARIHLSRPKNDRNKLDQNKLSEAISDYLQVLKTDKDNGLARAQLAAAYVESVQFKEALAEYDWAIERDTKNPDLLLKRAQAQLLKRAQAHMNSGDRGLERAYTDFLAAGHLFRDLQRLDDAEKAYSGAVGLFNAAIEISRVQQAKVHAELAEIQERRASLPANTARNRDLYAAAIKHFSEATVLDGTNWTYWSGLARCHERLEEWKEARQAFEKALKLNPGDPILTASWAGTLVKLKDWEKAAEAYLKIIQSQPKVLSHRLRLAEIYLQPIPPEKEVRAGRLEAARLCVAEAVNDEFLAKQSFLWSQLAVIEVAAGKIAEYQATRDRMFELFKTPIGNDANNVAWVAALFKDAPAMAERAIPLAKSAASFLQQNFNSLNTYGAVLYRAGKREEAIKTLEEATNRRALVSNLSPDQRAYGDALDKLFIAMAQYTPEQPEQARQTLNLAIQTVESVKPAEQSETPEQSLDRVWGRLEFELLRREATSLINH